jgi:long-chain acyl-CoA synthetase
MKLTETVRQNISLRFIDDQNGNEFTFDQLPQLSFQADSKKLVFLYLDNSLNSISVFWSLIGTKHCAALLSPTLNSHFKDELETLYQPAFIYDPTRAEIKGYGVSEENGLLFFTSEKQSWVEIYPDIKLLLSTSGTTGSPKFVKLSENNLLQNALSITDYLPIKPDDVTPLNLSIFYSYGLSILTSNCIKGGKIVCSNDDVLKKSFWEKFTQYGYTSIAGVPFVYEMLDRIGFTKKAYPSLRYFTQAGGKLQDNLVKKLSDYATINSIRFYVMYGQTEATARMSYLPPESLQDKIGSIGIPIKNGKFSIDPENEELCYSGPNVYGGYVTKPQDLSIYQQPAKLNTGDMARVDGDGFYYITGRLKRFVKLFGNRINLDEVEALVSKHLQVTAKCVGLNDKKLLVFLNSDAKSKETAEFIAMELKLHPTVIQVIVLQEMPLTANGKIDYNQLATLYGTN